MGRPPLENGRTERLLLSRLCTDDLSELCRMHADPRVMATLGGVRSPAETAELLARLASHWEEHGFGYWALREAATGCFAGRAGLRHVEIGGRDEVELGYALLPEFWGRGLATEIAAESVRAAFEVLGRDDLVCFTLPSNRASRRVMEKLGFRGEGDTTWAGLRHLLSRLTARDWRARR